MSEKNLFRWGGLVCILTGILWAVGTLLLYLATQYHGGPPLLGETLRFSSTVGLILAIMALYLAQFQQSGRMGLVSFFLAIVGISLSVIPEYLVLSALAGSTNAAVELNNGSIVASITSYTFVIGMAWFGTATFFAGVLPKWGALLLAVGVALGAVQNLYDVFPLFLFPLGAIIGGFGLVWMGLALFKNGHRFGLPQFTHALS